MQGDVADKAQLSVEQHGQAAIDAAQRSLAQAGRADCLACGEAINPARRAALPSAQRCAPCQVAVDKQQKMFGKK